MQRNRSAQEKAFGSRVWLLRAFFLYINAYVDFHIDNRKKGILAVKNNDWRQTS